ncbi:23S rRNA (adenine(2030)-N(6))-methyltransferase RlmJ [Pseudochelatococcus contaminans]|uniref:Ribosomal RNA large subunit methyltransferase J n=1 Tax=Pseudochelatococcus contaminans TaxID=1538103 RepID=A0A7W5Z3W3_9HYPH|nr:23S rRNA (adenine(2030)-N(6))-methyltransferase RlmJ [Pseudochelatococcus contaminans]MBB3809355.1 23S rRNA (adenine2030-N6)-methyltransferase [Pseudochelatococcus contaminans]
MNYRHAYHAGNFADCMKHALLARILLHLGQKDTPFRVIDTHAGIGLYDLGGVEAGKTLEWQEGIGRLETPLNGEAEELLAPFREALREVKLRFGDNFYPGSPLIASLLLRAQDKAIFVEKHPADVVTLAGHLARDRRLKVLEMDGWTALKAMIPPVERRGVVLIDPPFEVEGELAHLGHALIEGRRKWNNGIFAGWYPIKDLGHTEQLADILRDSGVPRILRLELLVDRGDDPSRLNGCGLVVINPPWKLAADAEVLLPALAERLARDDHAGFRCDWLAGE